jgi:hypothetical protein
LAAGLNILCFLSHERVFLNLHDNSLSITMSVLIRLSDNLTVRDLQLLHHFLVLHRDSSLSLKCEFFWFQAHFGISVIWHINIAPCTLLLRRSNCTLHYLSHYWSVSNLLLIGFWTNLVVITYWCVVGITTR